MEINRSKVVFTSPMETASRDLGADLKVSAKWHDLVGRGPRFR